MMEKIRFTFFLAPFASHGFVIVVAVVDLTRFFAT